MTDTSQLANLAIKHLDGKSDKAVYKAVLNACLEVSDLVSQDEINEAMARIKRSISMADKMVQA